MERPATSICNGGLRPPRARSASIGRARDYFPDDIQGRRDYIQLRVDLIRYYQRLVQDEILNIEWCTYCIENNI